MPQIIKIKNLNLKEKEKILLKNISFDIEENETLMILGHNGSGKSLLIDCILGNLNYDGEIIINKWNKNKIGILYDHFSSLPLLKVKEILQLIESLYGVSRNENLINELGISRLMNKFFKVLSKGENKKVGLYASLFMNPELLILDEPSDGLDPEFRKSFWEIIRKFKGTVILTTHLWEEAKFISDKIVFIENGIILNQPINFNEKVSELRMKGKVVVEQIDQLSINKVFKTVISENKIYIYFHNEEEKMKIIEDLNRNVNSSFSVLPIDLQDVYYDFKDIML